MSPVTLTSSKQASSSRTAVQPPQSVKTKAAPAKSVSTRIPAPTLAKTTEAEKPPIVLSVPANLKIHRSAQSFWKRAVDIVGGLIGLAFTALIFIPIALVIRWDSPGSVLYSQERCSVGGKRFRIWKFRSMGVNADAQKESLQNEASGHIFKMAADPRVTTVGKFLRRTSLDEFPQFWNVLMGDMSLVGTRPPSLDEVAKYEAHHWQRLAVKPGITGVWQVNGRSTVKDFEDIVKLDLSYQEDWSVGYDLYLIFKTVWVVFNKDGAC